MSGEWGFAVVHLSRAAAREAELEAAAAGLDRVTVIQARCAARCQTRDRLSAWGEAAGSAEVEAVTARFFTANPDVRPRSMAEACEMRAAGLWQ